MGAGDPSIPSSERPETGSINIALGECPATSTNSSVDAANVADEIIARFNDALPKRDAAAIAHLFLEEKSYWRDHLALTWALRTVQGRGKIERYLASAKVPLTQLTVDKSSQVRAPQFRPIDGWGHVNGIVFVVNLETEIGRGDGVVTLAEDQGTWKIFTLYTLLKELKGHEEPVGHRRPRGVKHGGDPDRKNWAERREEEKQNMDPKVLVLGAGQGGLTVAARLKMLNVPTLIIDSNNRVGDNWRKRYRQLVLHDPVWYDHMPYVPFPAHWPVFTPKDKLADFFEAYVSLLELNVWTCTDLASSTWDATTNQWTVHLARRLPDGTTESRTLHPSHIVQATGHSGKPNMPGIPGISDFAGDRLCHSSAHPGANPASKGKKAIVIGSCNSGHDIAQDFFEKGYHTTMIQRSSTCVISSEAIIEIGLKDAYSETSPAVDDADLFAWSMPSALFKAQQIKLTQKQHEHDRALLAGLAQAGFAVDSGPMNAGLTIKYFQRGGGYYIDVGCAQLIIDGHIAVKQGHEIARILPHGIALADGTQLPADEIVFATGYQNMRTQARQIFGPAVADRVAEVWGFNEEGELRTMWQRSGHPGLWFMGGNLAMARFFSRILALQINGVEEGLVPVEG